MIAKYSIMEGSTVGSIWASEEYITAQIRANVTDAKN